MQNETTYYIFSHEPLKLNELISGTRREVYNCPLKALFRGRCVLCYKIKIEGELRPPNQELNWDKTPRNMDGIFFADGFTPIEVIDTSWLMRRFAADLAILASEPYKNIAGRGDGWTEEFITYLETLDEGWRKENQSWYSLGPNQLMSRMMIANPAHALLEIVLAYNLLAYERGSSISVSAEFKKRIETLFDMRRVQRPISKGNGVFAYTD
jgi:hypothetical protein